jgi:transposase
MIGRIAERAARQRLTLKRHPPSVSRNDAVDGTLPPARRRHTVIVAKRIIAQDREPSMKGITTIGLDLAKSVFQVHGVDAASKVVVRRKLRRAELLEYFAKLPPCLIGMEACGTSHYWSRELSTLGHTVVQMPAEYVKGYRKRGRKTDAADAEAICEAVTRPRRSEVPTKSAEQQTASMPHTVRNQLITTRTAHANMIRSLMAEFGITAATGENGFAWLMSIVVDEARPELSALQRNALAPVAAVLAEIDAAIEVIDGQIASHAKTCPTAKRLASAPGIGGLISSAFSTIVTDPKMFKSGRAFSAWLGWTPKISGTGGEVTLGKITKAGNEYLRRLLFLGAASRLAAAKRCPEKADPKLLAMLGKWEFKKAAAVLANKMARMIWALMVRGGTYQDNHKPAAYAVSA